MPSRSARRKKAKRKWMQELAKIGKKKVIVLLKLDNLIDNLELVIVATTIFNS